MVRWFEVVVKGLVLGEEWCLFRDKGKDWERGMRRFILDNRVPHLTPL